MVSFCEDSLIGGSNIHVKKGFDLVLLPDYFCSFRYLVKSSRPFLSHDNHSANLSVAMTTFAFKDGGHDNNGLASQKLWQNTRYQ